MKLLVFLVYLVVEIAAFIGLISWLSFWPAVLVIIAGTAIGVLMLRRTAMGVLRDLSEAMGGRRSAGPALVDTGVVAAAVFLLAIPGVVSTVLGMLLLIKPVRALVRPLVAYLGAKRVARFVEESGLVSVLGGGMPAGFGTVVDGAVVDGAVVDGPGTRPRPGYRELPPA